MSEVQSSTSPTVTPENKPSSEIREIIKLRRFWLAYAWEDIKTTYRRTIFGIAWITISFLLLLGVKMLVFGRFANEDYVVYLSMGLLLWQYMSNILGSANGFQPFEGWVKNDTIPISGFLFIVLFRCLFNLAFSVLSVVIIITISGLPPPNIGMLTIIPAVIMMFVLSYFLLLLLSVISLRYRDFAQIIGVYGRVGVFLTPIIWYPEQMGPMMKYLWWNPASHFVWIIRDPIMGAAPPLDSWIYTSVLTGLVIVSGIVVYVRCRRHLIYWF